MAQDDRLARLVEDFLADLVRLGRSPHTVRAYRCDFAAFTRSYAGTPEGITADVVRSYLAGQAGAPATRARREASLAALLAWAYRTDAIPADPMAKVARTRLPEPEPRGLPAATVAAVFAAIPADRDRDRLLFRLVYTTGMRISEALGIHVDDLDLTLDDEHVTVTGKGRRRRTVLLDDPVLVAELRRYLRDRGYRHGPLFRAEKNHRGGPLRYQSAQALWARYCAAAKVTATLHQLRHAHATELVNAGVSLPTIRKRLGHKNLQTTLRYAEQADATADAEIRDWRRHHG
jgi:site-specific recombinase XerD